MGKIRLLSENLINRIAAGEVVERPASVLKELMENSLDAGSTRLEITARSGGRRLLSVADNGEGMGRDDLLLAIERHATSKLTEETDLLHIDTLGFRGEALPSIASVSRLTILSADNEEGRGRRVRISGGKILGVEEAARDKGTTIDVQDLFFNVPARKKFLKSQTTEAAHLLEVVQRYALGRPDLRLIYKHDDREILTTSPQEDAQTRLAKVVGRDAARSMLPFDGQAGPIRLSGFLGRPDLARSRTTGLYLFVNSRPVSDRLLVRSVISAYEARLMGGRYPMAVIFLDISPDLVDVNVHPAKAEVRFRQPGEVFAAAAEVMKSVLGEIFRPFPRQEKPYSEASPHQTRGVKESTFWESNPAFSKSEPAVFVQRDTMPEPRPGVRSEGAPSVNPAPTDPGANNPGSFNQGAIPQPSPAPSFSAPVRPEPRPGSASSALDLKPIGQLFRSYILAEGPGGLFVVDQHAAHERILFERFQTELAAGSIPSQALLIPETLELTPTESIRLEHVIPHINRFGFDVSPFGGRTFMIRSVPAAMTGKDPLALINEIVDKATDMNPKQGIEEIQQALLASLACHAALKAGQIMSIPEMDRLLVDLAQTRLPTNCPHGRPLIFEMGRREIEKRFMRA